MFLVLFERRGDGYYHKLFLSVSAFDTIVGAYIISLYIIDLPVLLTSSSVAGALRVSTIFAFLLLDPSNSVTNTMVIVPIRFLIAGVLLPCDGPFLSAVVVVFVSPKIVRSLALARLSTSD